MKSNKPQNTHTSNCPIAMKNYTKLVPTNEQYKTMAVKHEANKINNNIFNGKNLSDHTKASNYY